MTTVFSTIEVALERSGWTAINEGKWAIALFGLALFALTFLAARMSEPYNSTYEEWGKKALRSAFISLPIAAIVMATIFYVIPYDAVSIVSSAGSVSEHKASEIIKVLKAEENGTTVSTRSSSGDSKVSFKLNEKGDTVVISAQRVPNSEWMTVEPPLVVEPPANNSSTE